MGADGEIADSAAHQLVPAIRRRFTLGKESKAADFGIIGAEMPDSII